MAEAAGADTEEGKSRRCIDGGTREDGISREAKRKKRRGTEQNIRRRKRRRRRDEGGRNASDEGKKE